MRSTLLRGSLAAILAATPALAQQHVDVLIRGGTIVDGSGGPERRGDVGLRGDRITFIGDAARSSVTGARTIGAAGLVVAPGFIDPHTHTGRDLSNPRTRSHLPYLIQALTTAATNHAGAGPTDN